MEQFSFNFKLSTKYKFSLIEALNISAEELNLFWIAWEGGGGGGGGAQSCLIVHCIVHVYYNYVVKHNYHNVFTHVI